jgi:Fe-S cluster assembly protein SufD
MPADVQPSTHPVAGDSVDRRALGPVAARLRALDAGTGPGWLQSVRDAALAALGVAQLPDERTEAWRHTSLPALADGTLLLPASAAPGTASAHAPDGWAAPVAQALGCPSACIVDGRISLSSPGTPALAVAQSCPANLGTLAPLDDAFVALNAALLRDVLVIDVPADARIGPLLVQHRTSAGLHAQAVTRVVVHVGRNAHLTLIEEVAPIGGLHNLVTEVVLDEGARLEHWRASRGQSATGPAAVGSSAGTGSASTSIARTFVEVGRAASYQGYQQVEAGHRMREELHVALTGEGAEARLAGVAHLLGRDHGDIALRIEHRASNTTSSSTYRGIAGERGHFVFKGQIHIPEGVRAIDAALTNKNLLLSNDAEIDTRPELTINADDVRCSHGATIGQLDADALFLLRARGIDAALARGLIMRAFAVAALHALPEDDVRALFTERLRDALGAPA